MKLKIICMGNTSESYLQTGIDRYLGRLKHYAKVEWLELPEVKQTRKLTEAQIIEKEADLVRNQLTTSSYLVLLDEKGKQLNSNQLAEFLNQRMVSGLKEVIFTIGGPYGFDETLKTEAHRILSLSKLTFTHQMVRLILAEQLYRALTILRNEPYHHG